MSYCAIIPFSNGIPQEGIEFKNAWGGAARIWDSLFTKYLKNPLIPYHSWLSCGYELWDLAKRKDLELFERAVHTSTFDCAYIGKENFNQFVLDLRKFIQKYPLSGKVDHLESWAKWIESSDAEAVGFYGTSVSECPWYRYDVNSDEIVPKPLFSGFEVYDWLKDQDAKNE